MSRGGTPILSPLYSLTSISIRILYTDFEKADAYIKHLREGPLKIPSGNDFIFIYLFLTVLSLHRCAGLFLVVASQGYSLVVLRKFSLLWLLLLWSTGSRAHRISSCGSPALGRRLKSCGTQAWLLCRTWDLLRSGTEPMSPTLAGGFLITEPPGKPKPALKVKVTRSCPIFCGPMDCSPPGSSVRGILQTRILEWVAISFSRGSSQPRSQTQVSCIAGRFFTI